MESYAYQMFRTTHQCDSERKESNGDGHEQMDFRNSKPGWQRNPQLVTQAFC